MRGEHVLYATEIGRLALVARLTAGRALVGSWADGLQEARVMSDPSEDGEGAVAGCPGRRMQILIESSVRWMRARTTDPTTDPTTDLSGPEAGRHQTLRGLLLQMFHPL